MAGTTIWADEPTIPRAAAPIVEIKQNWSDDWTLDVELRVMRFQIACAGQDVSQCVLQRRYGRIKDLHESAIADRESINLDGWWIRLKLIDDGGDIVVFVGQVSGEGRDIWGSDVVKSGVQEFVAYGPKLILRKTHISKSYWMVEASEQELGWVPHMNARDAQTFQIGNRSIITLAAPDGSRTYVYGGTDLWTRYEYAEYVLKRFVDQSHNSGPAWWLGGQADLLKQLDDTVFLEPTQSASKILRDLIDPRLGIDYKIVPHDDGFEIFVFALQAEEHSFNGATLPQNPDTVMAVVSTDKNVPRPHIAHTDDHKYGKITLIGERIVVCCTLRPVENNLEKKWTDALETAYKAGTGESSDLDTEHDAVRRDEKFRPVYQLFGAPANWTHGAPSFDDSGEITTDTAPAQKTMRETLPWLPMLEGYDYNTSPPTNRNPIDVEPSQLPLQAWLYDQTAERYVLAEEAHVSVSSLPSDWGVLLQSSPNHMLALNEFDPDDADTEDTVLDMDNDPVYDYNELIVTLALRSDQRLTLSVESPDPDGTVKEIHVPGAEIWYALSDTVVGVDDDGEPLYINADNLVLRNDTTRMAFLMAGAMARYFYPRSRARIHIKGWRPWPALLGKILTVVEEDGDTDRIQAPITSVSWTGSGKSRFTVVRTGFAK